MKQIRQAITRESLFLELQLWCREGAGRKSDELKIISAFATGAAVEVLEPFLDIFLSDGNLIDVIVGIDRNGTNREAIRRLFELQEAYSGQFTCYVFHAPSNIGIFHPKLYLYRSGSRLSAIIGSANLTLGGLGNNFESVFAYNRLPIGSKEAKELVRAWDAFARPIAPLDKRFLRKLTRRYVRTLLRSLPVVSNFESEAGNDRIKSIWKPISRITLPRSNERVRKSATVSDAKIMAFLLIDVLTETRQTQMQLPLMVVESFFRLARDQPGNIKLSFIRGGQITQPIERRIVVSGGRSVGRLMRRIEMPQIAGKSRPLAAIFFRLSSGRFAVGLAPQATRGYQIVNRTLRLHGQQPEHAVRRYYIGTGDDLLLQALRPILASELLSIECK